jgi:hypothetical protein
MTIVELVHREIPVVGDLNETRTAFSKYENQRVIAWSIAKCDRRVNF